jgi:hypothetical protein
LTANQSKPLDAGGLSRNFTELLLAKAAAMDALAGDGARCALLARKRGVVRD